MVRTGPLARSRRDRTYGPPGRRTFRGKLSSGDSPVVGGSTDTTEGAAAHLVSLLSLRRSRALLAQQRGGGLLAATIALVYAFVSLIVGLMLELGPTDFRSTTATVITDPGGGLWWNYPGLIVTAPNAVLVLPFFPTITMALVAMGVGLGMAVAVVLSLMLARQKRREHAGPAGVGTVAGLTPAMIALVTLGACCSTTAAAGAGIGLAAQASGTTYDALLLNTWYLGIFQMVILGAALLAQEQLAVVYSVLLPATERADAGLARSPAGARYYALGALRAALLVGGVTWALAWVAEWTLAPPGALWGAWFSGLFEHLLPAGLAVGVALAPGALRHLARPSSIVLALRAALAVGAVTLLGWTPPAMVSAGVHGLVNELLGAGGAPASWGAAAVPGLSAGALALRWGFQFVLVGGLTLAVATYPRSVARAFRVLAPRPDRAEGLPAPGPTGVPTLGPLPRGEDR